MKKNKQLTITEILRSHALTQTQKKLAWERWKWNQLPEWYRSQHREEINKKLKIIELSESEVSI